MAVDYTTTALLASIRRRAMLPTSDRAYSDADLLALATEELQTYIVDLLLDVNAEYLVTRVDYALTQGTAAYALPERAIGGEVRNLLIQDGSDFRALPYIEPERIPLLNNQGAPIGFRLEGNNIVLYPRPSTAGTLRLYYYRRPSVLVTSDTTNANTIDTVNVGAGSVHLVGNAFPTDISTNTDIDIVSPKPMFDLLGQEDNNYVQLAGTTSTFGNLLVKNNGATAVVSSAMVGAYVCRKGESPIPQIPVELHPLLATRVAYSVVKAVNDKQAAFLEAECDRLKKIAVALLSPRTKGGGRVVLNRFGPGWRNFNSARFRR